MRTPDVLAYHEEVPLAKGLSIGSFPLLQRRVEAVRTVASGVVNRTIPQAEYVAGCIRYQQEAQVNCRSMPEIVRAIWRCEGFTTTFGKFRLPDNTLNDQRLPRECLGIVHVGYGAASAEFTRFDPFQLHSIARRFSAPNYQDFVYEGMGSTLRLFEPGFFRFLAGVLGLIPMDAPPGPGKDGFFTKWLAEFSPEQQRLVSHGYGRLMAFSNSNLSKALDEVLTLPEDRILPALQGLGFAFAMMNSEDIVRLLDNSSIDDPRRLQQAFQTGLVCALVFCDWFAPGFLSYFRPKGSLADRLTALAREEAAANQKRGHLLPFRLENPQTIGM